MMRYRARRYPTSGTCGSFFRNFTQKEISGLEESAVPSVAYYLDRVGIKGSLAIGKARVSYQHANMIVNTGGATAREIADVARLMQEKVFTAFGIVPQPECLLIGFDDHYPLLR
jgi:UDP-N-acetylmuramate dehydrogenase